VRYLNRLADLLFVLAREANRIHGIGDEKWSPTP
jgi:cob(I)alamin adenosyltransferase